MKSDVIQSILKSRISTLQHHIFEVVGGFVLNDLRRYTKFREITSKFVAKDVVSMRDVKAQDGLAYISYDDSKSVMIVLNYSFISTMFEHAFDSDTIDDKEDKKKHDIKPSKKDSEEISQEQQGCTDIESYIAGLFANRIFDSIKDSLLYKYQYTFQPKVVNYKSMNSYLISLTNGTLWEVKFEGGAFDENAILRIFLSNEFAEEILINEHVVKDNNAKNDANQNVNVADRIDPLMLEVVFGMHLKNMMLKDISNITVGQKFVVEGNVTESVIMSINNRVFAMGSLGEVENDRALKINFINKV